MMSKEPITVVLADDHAMVREGLAALLAKDPQVNVVGQCGDGLTALEEIRRLRPDVAVLDITMPGLNGIDLCRELARKAPNTAILILTMHDAEELVADALAHGASGYLLKEAAADQLTEAIRKAAAGEVYLTGISKNVLARATKRDSDPYQRLTLRERQVLQLVAEGKTNREVAKQLGLAVKTVDTHRTRLMRKLNIHDQTSLVKYALRKRIISLE